MGFLTLPKSVKPLRVRKSVGCYQKCFWGLVVGTPKTKKVRMNWCDVHFLCTNCNIHIIKSKMCCEIRSEVYVKQSALRKEDGSGRYIWREIIIRILLQRYEPLCHWKTIQTSHLKLKIHSYIYSQTICKTCTNALLILCRCGGGNILYPAYNFPISLPSFKGFKGYSKGFWRNFIKFLMETK